MDSVFKILHWTYMLYWSWVFKWENAVLCHQGKFAHRHLTLPVHTTSRLRASLRACRTMDCAAQFDLAGPVPKLTEPVSPGLIGVDVWAIIFMRLFYLLIHYAMLILGTSMYHLHTRTGVTTTCASRVYSSVLEMYVQTFVCPCDPIATTPTFTSTLQTSVAPQHRIKLE